MLIKYEVDVSHLKPIINRVKQFFPTAKIAGGAIRDKILGVNHKDVDVFIEHHDTPDENMKVIHCTEMLSAKYMPQTEVTRIWDVTPVDSEVDLPSGVQIIMLQKGLTLEERIVQYDFGFCQCFYDGEAVYVTEAFLEDVKNNTATLTHCEDDVQYARSMRRFARFADKFKGLTLKYTPDTVRFCNLIIT